jgi:iron complex outermembrane receptor protein
MKKIHLIRAGASLGLLFPVPALAQSQVSETSAEPAAQDDDLDIVITAQRREQSLQDVPLSVTALSGETLAERGINDITTLSASVPGLNFGRSGADARPAIRGVRTEEVDAANDPVIGFFVDGVYKPRTSQALAAFVDVDRVEVLRGPQGTLFGRNTYGGSVSVFSRLPEPDFGVRGEVRYASFNDIRLEGVLNVPVGANSGLRFVGMWQESDGYVKVLAPRTATGGRARDFNDNDQYYLRGIFRSELTDAVEVILRASYWDQGGFGAGGFGYTTVGTLRQNPGAGPGQATGTQDLGGLLDRNNPRSGATPGPSDESPYRVYRNTDVLRDTRELAGNGEINVDMGGVRVKSLTSYADFSAYRQNDEDFSEANASLLELETDSKSFSQELQLLPDQQGPLQWVLGAYYFRERAVEDFFFRTPTNPNSFTFRQDVTTNSYAVYAQAEYGLTDAITLLAGGRYTIDDKRFIYQSPVGTPDLAPDEAKFKKFTWRLGVNVDITPDNLLYLSASTGFRSGGFNNGGSPPVPFYGPQTVTAYEVGLKNLFRASRLTLNVSAFYNDYNDILANTFVQVGPTNVVARSNSGSSRAYGLEAEMAWRPVGGLEIDANAAWLNARFKQFSATRPVALATGYTLVPGSTNQLDLAGKRVPLSPEFTFNIGGRYDIDLGSAGTFAPEVRFFWSDDYFVNEFNYDAGIPGRPVGRMPSYTRTDLSLTWRSPEDRFSLQAFVQNLENKAVLNRSVIGGQGAIFQNFAPPRIIGVRASFKM